MRINDGTILTHYEIVIYVLILCFHVIVQDVCVFHSLDVINQSLIMSDNGGGYGA
jgi:hypothetical protein